MNAKRMFPLAAALLALAALSCNLPIFNPPTPIAFATPDLTMTAVFVGAQTQAVATLVAPPASQTPTGLAPTSLVPLTPSPTATLPPPTATFTASPTSTNPPPPPPPTNTPTQSLSGPGQRPKFPVIAYFVDDPPYIDGELDEWNLDRYNIESVVYGGRNIEGSEDLSGRAMFTWDDDFLYIGVRVIDDVYAQDASRANLYKGDSLEILLDADVSSDYHQAALSADDFQLGISPGSPEPGEDVEAYLWFPSFAEGSRDEVKIASRLRDDGYIVEAAIPWDVFLTNPYEGAHFGFCLSISDNDNPGQDVQQSMVSNVPIRTLTDPRTWGDLQLVD